jgi:hypothetical protein
MSTMVYTSGEIDLTTWKFTAGYDPMMSLIMKGFAVRITEVLRDEFDSSPPILELPIIDAKDTSYDPLMIEVLFPLGKSKDHSVGYACSLESALDELMENLKDYSATDAVGRDICARVSARLRELAQKIDDSICAGPVP